MMKKKLDIAIDGPSGVGKSTIAKILAQELNLTFINTGLTYRAVGYYCLKNNLDLNNEKLIYKELKKNKIELFENETIKLNNQDISNYLWNDEISDAASKVAKLKLIRKYCVRIQQNAAKRKNGVIMEGRDIGSVVLKKAKLKFFLEASPDVRALRRFKQLNEKGEKVDKDEILRNINERDKRDTQRKNRPLRKVNDAITIDTTKLSLDEVVQIMINYAREKNF